MEDIKEYYITKFAFDASSAFALWYTEKIDGFVLDSGNKIKTFKDEKSVKIFAQQNNYNLNDEKTEILCISSSLLDFKAINCNSVITFWNIVSDAANSLNLEFLGDIKDLKTTDLYNKLFFGCNLPALKNDGDDFSPSFSAQEKQLLRKLSQME